MHDAEGLQPVTTQAVAKTSTDRGEEGLAFSPPLYSQRAQLVQRVLQRYACRRLVDAGCSYGDLLLYLMHASSLSHLQLTEVTAIDLDRHALAAAANALPFSSAVSLAAFTEDCTLQCLHGDLASSAPIPATWLPCASANNNTSAVDAVISIEVIEHIPPHLVAAYTHTVFAELGAARGAVVALLTTPNRDENYRLPPLSPGEHSEENGGKSSTNGAAAAAASASLNSIYRPYESAPRRRHDEHFFELTRAQWGRYVRHVEACYGAYWRAAETVLLGDGFTQGTLFVAHNETRRRKEGNTAAAAFSSSLLSRDAAIAAFPFEEIFGMAPDDYAAHFLSQSTAAAGTLVKDGGVVDVLPGLDSCGCDHPFTRVEHRVIHGVPLWERLRDVVRRGAQTLQLASTRAASETFSQHHQQCTSMSFDDFYATRLAPQLHTILEDCTLPLLVAALREQRVLWEAAAKKDAVRWRQWYERGKTQGWLHACRLRLRDAHVRVRSASGDTSHLTSAPLVLPSMKGGERPVRLCPIPSVASTALEAATHMDAVHCALGVQLLQRGHANTVGLLLTAWLSAQVEDAVAVTDGSDGSCEVLPQVSARSSGSACARMKLLRPHLLRLLFFLVSVDVLHDAYVAIGADGAMLERHRSALYRDVCSMRTSPFDGCRRRRRRWVDGPAEEAHFPYWLQVLLKATVSVS